MKTIYTWTAREQGRLHGAYEQFSPTEISCDFCCVTFVSLFINLRHPRDFTLHTPQRGTLHYYIYMCVFGTSAFFSTGLGSFLVLSAPWHAGSPPGPRTQVWALAKVRGTCSGGSKWQVPSGRDSEHVEPSRCMQTQEQVKAISDGSCDIWDLECHQRRQRLLT